MAEVRRSIGNQIRQPLDVAIRRSFDQIDYRPTAVRRMSWGAALAGVAIALVIQLVLSLLGVGIGMSTVEPLTGETPPTATLGTAAGMWWMVSWCIALWLGGWVAGRLAGMPRRLDATLHGVLTWAFTTLVLFYLLTTAIGDLIGGGFMSLGNVLATSGRGVATIAPGLDLPWENIQHDIDTLLQQTGKAPLPADTLGETGRQATGSSGATNQDLSSIVERLIRHGKGASTTVDRETAINVMVAQTGMSREQAAQTLRRWEEDYQRGRAELAQQARQAAASTAKTASQASLWTVLALVLGAVVAALGGALGTPHDLSTAVIREG
jgi:post-segregation antitoxin (ccd killing protein)